MAQIIVHQSIHIQTIRVGAVSNSSVFQIGSAGVIKPTANLNNTGQYQGPAPEPKGFTIVTDSQKISEEIGSSETFTPLTSPRVEG
ncbi:spore germination protein GerPB [Mangrovibacillus cuniculi]|uniref:Spore gernimation protein GerPB n=1 Tax=Mangrovibacillus cuniculi TaxID=2593652 RepID=A0A7S8C9T1_9BACI|nr:spore germination protein GerPB [Mangrovibacillus cuniculi]QPC46030.1 spore gernimation protein GerPB [Mangrovibacillus cuniculi]